MAKNLQIGNIESHSTIYGPGSRFVIWTQGCNLACPGCWNQQFWEANGGRTIAIEALVEEIRLTEDIEGITLLGGEPFQQLDAVVSLVDAVKSLGLSVFLYTGYNKKEFSELMWQCYYKSDIVVSGRYLEKKRSTTVQWRGSSNQVIDFPTKRYSNIEIKSVRQIEYHMVDGQLRVYGYPDDDEIPV